MAEKIEFDLLAGRNTLDSTLDSSIKKAGKLEGVLNTALGVFAGNLITKAFDSFVDGFQSIIDVAGDAVEAASVQQKAINELNSALQRNGEFSQQTSQDLQDYASELQRITTFGDEAIISQLAFAQSMGASAEQSKQIVAVAADMSAALGIDFNSAVRNVAKTLGGFAGELGEVIPELKNLNQEQLRAGQGIDILAAKFAGAAGAQLNTFSGSVQSLKNAFGDLLEPIGEIIVENDALIGLFSVGKEIILAFTTIIQENKEALKELVQDGIFLAISAFKAFAQVLDAITVGAKGLVAVFEGIARAIGLGIIETFRVAYDAILLLIKSIPVLGDSLSSLKNPLDGISNAFREGLVGAINDFKNAADDNVFTNAAKGADFFADKLIGASEKVRASAEIQNQANSNRLQSEQIVNDQIRTQREQLNNDLLLLQQQLADDQAAFDEQLQIASLDEGTLKNEARILALAEQQEREAVALFEGELRKNQAIKDGEAQRLANQKAFAALSLAQGKINNQKEIALLEERRRAEEQINNLRLNALQGFLSAGLTLAKEGSVAQKALQTATAVTSTYTAANQALSSPPGPPFTLPLVAATIAQGLANVARINAVRFQEGGIVGASRGPDNQVAAIRTGEMVLNADDQKTLFDAIKSGNLGGGNIVVQIDGRNIATAIRDQIRGGFKLV